MKIIFALLILALNTSVFAASDLPEPGEAFPSYFARITRGGKFPGIYLNAPESVQRTFLEKIQKSYWVSLRNQERKTLESQGVDLWFHWYTETKPGSILLPTEATRSKAEKAYQEMIQRNPSLCEGACPSFSTLLQSSWDEAPSWKRQLLTLLFVTEAPVFGDSTMLAHLAKLYELSEQEVRNNVDIKILGHNAFAAAAREMGWSGEIYFRGITGPDPKNPLRRWILLDDERLGKNSPFDRTLFRMMELPGILLHELSHVCQDIRGHQLKANIEVTSAEDALIIEGSAEYLAEKALFAAGDAMDGINPWKLFVREQATEIVYREGNESSGNLFPYTVGMPFVTALFSLSKTSDLSEAKLRDELLHFLDSTGLAEGKTKPTLELVLMKIFSPSKK